MSIFSLQGKTAVVTGGGSGIGKAISTRFAEQGAHVHLLEMNLETANKTVEEIQNKGYKATAHECNVADQKVVFDIIKKITKDQTIDILVNNAGIAHVGNIEGTAEADIDRLYQVNIKGVYNCMKAAIENIDNIFVLS